MALSTGQLVVGRPAAAALPMQVRFRALQRVVRRTHRVGQHVHTDHELLLIRAGTYRGLIDGVAVVGAAPCLVAVGPGQRHADACDAAVRFDAAQIRLLPGPDGDTSAPLLLAGRGAVTRLDGDALVEAVALFDAMIGAGTRRDATTAPLLDALAAALLWRWLGLQPADALQPAVAAVLAQGDLARRIDDLCAANVRGPLSVPQMAAALGLPIRTLDWQCRRLHGLAPARLFRRRRMEAARTALKCTDLSVQAIAEHFGFASATHFARLYRAEFGVAPGRDERNAGGAG
jgi:AraC-like DNA-binding protein